MSVVVTIRVGGDTERFRSYVPDHGETLEAIAADAKANGCLHHRFAVGEGYILVVDEWETAESFQAFFDGNEAIAGVMRESGAQSEPEISMAEAIDTADMF
jgi:heme-degrading monooxygenase HmoA